MVEQERVVEMVAQRQTTGTYGTKFKDEEFITDPDTAKTLEAMGIAKRKHKKNEATEEEEAKAMPAHSTKIKETHANKSHK
jgi:hypothetical protein